MRIQTQSEKLLKWSALGLLSFLLAIATPPALAILQSPTTSTTPSSAPTSTTAANTLSEGRSLYQAGRFADAATAWQEAAQAYEKSGDRVNQGLSLSYLSLAYQELSQWDEATQAIEQSRTLLKSLPQVDAIIWAQTLNTHAKLLLATGQTQAALDTWEEAQTFYDRANDKMGAVGSQINQAQALQILGFYRKSRTLLEELEAQLASEPDSELKAITLRSLGSTLNSIGELEASREVLESSLAIFQRLENTAGTSAILLSLGNTARDLGDVEAALDYLQQAQQAAATPQDRLDAQLNQLRLYVESQRFAEAATLAPEIQRQLTSLPSSRATIFGTVNLAESLLAMNPAAQPIRAAELNQLLATAVRSAQTLKDPQAQAYALSKWGKLYAQNQQWSEAADLEQQSLAIAQSLDAKDITAQAAWQLGRILKQQGKRQEAIAAYSEAIGALQALRGDLASVSSDVQFSFRESVEPVYRELVALLLDSNPTQANLIQVRELIEGLQLAELDNFFHEACLDSEVTQIDEIDDRAAVIYSMMLPDRLAVIISTAGQPLQYHSTPIGKTDAEQTVRGLLAALHPASDNKERLRLSQQVYNWLLPPAAQSTLADRETLVFVLDGLMRKIPVAALHDGQQYLIEQHAVALSPGLKLMASQSLAQKSLQGVVAGISQSLGGLSALPGVELEVAEVSQSVSASPLLNQNFTKEALEHTVNHTNANVLHLATHGQFSSKQEDTFLLTWNGRLNIRELSELLRRRETQTGEAIELLVLSACNTAVGDDRAVLGLAGLAVKSGARSTLASLWPVKDRVAVLLMSDFYKNLKQPNMTKAEALRQAQLKLLADEGFNDPFFWSSFTIVGNWL
jgi:CHAT domain-containing protein